ncbi:hypothetical protein DY988_15600 [Pseudomonas aeruginosa]|nr:hypothetical protein DY988_15600 [Pseudomonas aeruginosa]
MTAFRRHDLAQVISQAQLPLGPRESPNIDLFASAELCRFSSHCAHHYSTAQHSYFVVFLAVEEHQLTAIWLGMKNDYFLVSARLHKHRHIPESETLATAQENLDLLIQRLWQRWPVNFFLLVPNALNMEASSPNSGINASASITNLAIARSITTSKGARR